MHAAEMKIEIAFGVLWHIMTPKAYTAKQRP